MTEAYELAGKKSSEVGARAKQCYDCFVRSSVLLPGDRVLVRNLSERDGPGKLRSHWEYQVHVVVSRKGDDSLVYEVKPEVGTGGNRILHRNAIISLLTYQARLARREQESRRISVVMFNRYLHHMLKRYQMEAVVMMSMRSSQRTPTLGRP